MHTYLIFILLFYTILADHVALKCDVSKEQEIQQTWEKIQTGLGHVSYLVNAAGVNRFVTYPLIADLSVKLTLCILTEGRSGVAKHLNTAAGSLLIQLYTLA